MKRWILYVLALVLVLTGCAGAPEETTNVPRETGFGWALHDDYVAQGIEMEDFEDNLEYDYVRLFYNGWYHYSPTMEERDQGIRPETWVSDWNLTHTAMKERGSSYVRGAMVLENMHDYNAIVNAIDATRITALENCGVFWEPEETQRTWEGSFDEAFFEDHVLVLIDHCYEGHPFLRSRLDSITEEPGEVTVKLSWETVHAYTADQPGEVYWIILTKPCGRMTVEYTETACNL